MLYDLAKWMCNPQWQTCHLIGINQAGSKVIQHCVDTGKTLVFIKTDSGNPWDMKAYDNTYIYDTITERSGASADWQNASNYKLNGWPMLPRYWNGDPTWSLYHASAPWKTFTNCKQDASGDVGPVWYTLQGPFIMDHGGDVALQSTILCNYYWAGGKTREQLFMTDPTTGYGWITWTSAVLQPNGLYQVTQWSTHNTVVKDTKPLQPKFGCYAIP